jgi:hypothetical protein
LLFDIPKRPKRQGLIRTTITVALDQGLNVSPAIRISVASFERSCRSMIEAAPVACRPLHCELTEEDSDDDGLDG